MCMDRSQHFQGSSVSALQDLVGNTGCCHVGPGVGGGAGQHVKVVELASDRMQAAPNVFPQLSVALKDSGVLVTEGEVLGCWPGQSDEAGDGVQVDEVLTGVDHPTNASHFSWAVGLQGDNEFCLEREGCFEEGFAADGWRALVMAGAADRGIEAARTAFDDDAALVGVEVFVLDSGDEGDALGL